MTLTGPAVRSQLVAAGVPFFLVSEMVDAVYKPCEFAWLTGDFHSWVLRSMSALDIRDFTPESGDCDDFCALFATFARILHRRAPDSAGTALPIGRLSYMQTPTVKHSINWAITRDRGLVFPEPQVLGRVESLTPAQLVTCTHCSE